MQLAGDLVGDLVSGNTPGFPEAIVRPSPSLRSCKTVLAEYKYVLRVLRAETATTTEGFVFVRDRKSVV